jgi:predicted glutamine amidotransferase
MHAEQMSQCFNADGFGVGFYTEGHCEPCVLRSTMPAWSNQAIHALAHRMRSARIFAHVRAASPGLAVQDSNCHPFRHGRFQFMHNGWIGGFHTIKRRLQNGLSDPAWDGIEGSTDSEHAFALFIDKVGGPDAVRTTTELRTALVDTLLQLSEICASSGVPEPSICNFAVTDGVSTIVSRKSTGNDRGASLYFSVGAEYVYEGEDCDMLPARDGVCRAVMVASEPLTRRIEDWVEIPPNHTIAIDPTGCWELDEIRV